MSYVIFDLIQASTLISMSPPPAAGGGFGPAALPAGMAPVFGPGGVLIPMPGMYLILNTEPANLGNNRYIGIAADIGRRFGRRLETVTELGFSAAIMNNVGAYWGTAHHENTPGVPPAPGAALPVMPAGPPLAVAAAAMPAVPAAVAAAVAAIGAAPAAAILPGVVPVPATAIAAPPPAPPAPYNLMIDGIPVHLERLLIRTVMRFWPLNTISNNLLTGPYINPTGFPVIVILNWGAAGAAAAGAMGLLWPAGAVI